MDQRDADGGLVSCAAGGAVEAPDGATAAGAIERCERAVADVLRDLHDGRLKVESMPAELRRQCVDHLTDEGFSRSEIARLMEVSERTVTRDRAAIRSEGAIAPSLRLGDELMGELERITLAAIQRLRRLGGDSKTPAYAKLWAAEATVRVYERFIDRARAMRYCTDGSEMLNYMLTMDKTLIKREDEVRAANRVRDRKILASVI